MPGRFHGKGEMGNYFTKEIASAIEKKVFISFLDNFPIIGYDLGFHLLADRV